MALSRYLIFLFLPCLLLTGLLFFGLPSAIASGVPEDGTLVIESSEESHTFLVELAATPATRARGLMHRREIRENSAMLFDFIRDQQVTMWMKNTWVSLDMLFVDAGGQIVNIAHRTVPHSLKHIRSHGPVRAVLEIKGGLAKRLHLKAGDRLRHRMFLPRNSDR
jgi:uncharacterized protein